LISPSIASAVALLDSFLPNNGSNGSSAVVWNPFNPIFQELGMPFEVATTTEITDILIALQGSGSFAIGVQGSQTTAAGAVPNFNFLYSSEVQNPTLNYSLSNLSWILAPGRYFLVARATSRGSGAGWGYGVGPSPVASVSITDGPVNSPWFYPSIFSLAVRINGQTSPIPEPSTYAMFAAALGPILLLAARRSRKQAQA
jgi:hypothetical protein